jgi:hypothetical protein
MSIRTFWTILLKVLGIWLILDSLTVIPQFFTAFSFFGNNQNDSIIGVIVVIGLLLLTVGIYLLILKLFVYNSNWIIDKLKLDKGFQDETIDLNIKLKTVLTIATIVIGGLVFIDSLPILCKEIFILFQHKTVFIEDPNFGWIIFYFVKTLIGYMLMTNSKSVIEYIDKQTTKTEN